MQELLTKIFQLIEPTGVILALVLLLILNSTIFKKLKSSASDGNILKGAISILIVFVGILAFVLVLPIDKSLKGQILGFLGIVVSAGIALSSTTVLGNLIAGIMNNSMNRFRNGDLIKIGDFYGRVIKKSIFHTEIQMEDSNIITVPNLYVASNPVKMVRKTNTVISTTISLGYDVPRIKIEEALKEAALATGLTDPYVYIISLGDFSVVYRIHGFLSDSSKYFSTNSLLKAMVMDKLHARKIEIVSPSFMNQRRVDDQQFIPHHVVENEETASTSTPEKLVFDEAIQSGKMETKKDYLKQIEQKQTDLREKLKGLTDEKEQEQLKAQIAKNEEIKARLEKSLKQ